MSSLAIVSRRMAWIVTLIVLCICLAAHVSAGEENAYADLMKRYDRVNDELQKALADLDYQTPVPDIPERVLSLRKNATVAIGGEMRSSYAFTVSDISDPGFDPTGLNPARYDISGGSLSLPTLKMLVDARIHNRWRVYMDFNVSNTRAFHPIRTLENPNTPSTPAPDITNKYTMRQKTESLEQAYIELMKEGHSGFGFLAGRMKLPFGLWDRPNLPVMSFMDAPNLAGSGLPTDVLRADKAVLPHASRSVDPVHAVMVNYEMRDIVRFEAAVFQEREQKEIRSVNSDGTFTTRNENGIPQSWQIGASIMPLDGWELTMHFRNRHNRGRGLSNFINSPFRWDFRNNLVSGSKDPRWDTLNEQWSDTGTGDSFGSTKNEQSLILGLAVEVPNTNLAVRAEYSRGWNQGFNKYIKSENVNLGFSYKLAPRLTVHGQGEWLQVKDSSWMTKGGVRDRRNNHLYRAMAGFEYEAFKGMTIEAGWQYEYWRMKSMRGSDGNGPDRRVNKAHTLYIGTRFVF